MTAGLAGQALTRLQSGGLLRRDELAAAFRPILNAEFAGADVAWGALFAALHARGATPDEVLGLVDAILDFDVELARQLQSKVPLSTGLPVIAIAGSGKESFKTFNVSTAAAFVASAHPQLCVIKPAGRATSATTGASEVLEALGIRLPKSLDQVAAMVRRCRVGIFDYHLVAPRYGPRYEGRFHHLHPLSHVTPWLFTPFRVDGLVFGVADARVQLAAFAMAKLGVHRAVVVSTLLGTEARVDEYAPYGTADIASLRHGAVRVERHEYDTPTPAQLSRLAQQPSHAANAALVLDVLHGRASQVATELVCANAGLILEVAGVAGDHPTGVALAEDLVRSHAAAAQLDACRNASQQLD